MTPPATALTTACARVAAPSLILALSRWKSTVRLAIPSFFAIWAELRPHFGARDAGQPRVDDGSENVEIDRLPDVIVRTELSPLELIFSAGLSGHEHKRHASEARGDIDQSLQYFESRHDRQIDIAQYEVGLFFQDCDKP